MAANVNVILSRDLPNLGRVGEVVKVKPGYARNFLFPKRVALPVKPEHVANFAHQKRLIEHHRIKLRTQSEKLRDELAKLQITIAGKAGDKGKLFGSIGKLDIEKAVSELGYQVHHRDIKLEAPIKSIGLHKVEVRLEADVKATLNVVVVPEKEEELVAQEEHADATAETSVLDDEIRAYENENS